MRLLISALAAASIIGFSFASYAGDTPYTAQPKLHKSGRDIDDGTVMVGKPKKFGREIDGETVKATGDKKFGRELDADSDGKVNAPKKPKYARAADDNTDSGTVKTPKKMKDHGRALDETADSGTVKTPKKVKEHGRAVDE